MISKKFNLKSKFKPIADQRKAINLLYNGIIKGIDQQVLLGVTGSGKTFTVANVIEKLQRPTLIISHNKTLAGQLYQEFRDFFPDNSVQYFVSYYDYYQPESYIPATDTYIEKDSDINELIDKLRLSTTTNLLTRNDVIVVASVSCIYNLGNPVEYKKFVFEFNNDMKIKRSQIIDRLINLQYERGEFGFHRGTFRIRGNLIDIYPAYQDDGIRIDLDNDKIRNIQNINTITGEVIRTVKKIGNYYLYPAKHYLTDPYKNEKILKRIEKDTKDRIIYFKKKGKMIEAQRIEQRVSYDLSMIKELGYVKGIENYSRYFDGRLPGEPPYTLLDYFNKPFGKDWLLIVDESHMTFPQIRGMYNGDYSRKNTLIDYGFRLPAAIDNRPLKFDEFMRRIPNFIATSATPSNWEISMANESAKRIKNIKNISKSGVTEQLVRPTGILDPLVEIKPIRNQVSDVISEIEKESKHKKRTLVTTLTKKTAEDLSEYLREKGILVQYLHSDVDTLERTDILDDLRKGKYDCIVGVNLLREGLDIPEVSLVAILDADKEGFLRSEVSLIQTMGRAARHVEGRIILYADNITGSIKNALSEVRRRRKFQLNYNKIHKISPRSIQKPIRKKIIENDIETELDKLLKNSRFRFDEYSHIQSDSFTPYDKKKLIPKLRKEMKIAASNLDFELAAQIRDKIKEFEG